MPWRLLSHDTSAGLEVNLHLFADGEYEGAGVTQAPLHVGYEKICGDGKTVPGYPDDHGDGERMTGPSEAEGAVHLHGRCALCGDGSSYLDWREDNIGVMLAGEDICVHLAITRVVAGVSARRIDHAYTADRTVHRIEAQGTLLDPKGAMDRMEQSSQRKSNVALGWMQFKDSRRPCQRSGTDQAGDEQQRNPNQ